MVTKKVVCGICSSYLYQPKLHPVYLYRINGKVLKT
ncbi:MAG: hypothetical protein KJO81_01860 [Gammaproteobacteria bacterium]|nr:hypothetical protein [Gammaproteobacteria bacterium]NNC67595.1 hypothetical protein [Gammaproteobacteria bacterium]